MTAPSPTLAPVSDAAPARGGVEIVDVTKHYGDATAVDRLSLSIRPGEFLSLLGPSGCGKTTTLRMIAGFEYPDEGDIRLSGRSVLSLPPHLREVNTVFQAYALFPHMTVAENVAYGLQQRKVPKAEQRERVAEALDMVQLRRFADRKPTQLSGGQQQRIALSRALINRPAVLLLDEPLAALDRQLREEMQLELKLLQSRLGTTFVFVTHDQAEALSMSDRIAVMRAGRIEQLAAPADIYAEPASAYVASFIGQQNFLHGTVAAGQSDAVATAAGVLRGRWGGERGAAGSAAVAAIRPEFVRLTAPGATGSAGYASDAASADGAGTPGIDGLVLGVSHLGETLQFLGVIPGPLGILNTRGAVLLGVVYNYLPLMILPLFVAFDRVSGPLREASKDLGAGSWTTFLRITVPLARPGIIAGVLLVYIPLMGDYITATVLGGAKGNMVGQIVASQFQTAQNWALGSAMAVLLILTIGLSIAVAAAIGWLVTIPIRRSYRLTLEEAR